MTNESVSKWQDFDMSQLKYSSHDFPENEHVSACQDSSAEIASIAGQFHPDRPSFAELTEQLLPNLRVYVVTTTPSSTQAACPATENGDNPVLLVPLNGIVIINLDDGDPVCCQPGDAILGSNDLIHHAHIADAVSIAIIDVPVLLITSGVNCPAPCLTQKVASTAVPELRLLVGYTKMLMQLGGSLSLDLASLVSTQIHDLVTLLFGTKRKEAHMTGRCGLRAARLRAVKHDIMEHIADSELSINQVALHQGISPQYIRTLFHSEDTTFADYVTGLRLEQAYRHLCNPLCIDHCISTLAFELGFNNLSWFNRAFKQRFGLTPSEARNLFRQSADQS
ncbi:AraC family transcriptional regulator [Nitrosomonas sp. HPC101]|uniref:helix-turn-helix domain-containing protein n=1 Tax=Nitrosomonas sp. HPC101 TaxID=1658667 RepID=UPI001367FEE9|nr:AraC family transcriptional regulator [Nitrosomonas sp. HPC101]MXS86168.1 AraC family transcriptional regulator [Nitrosomonas sp. HPC101]